MLAQRLGIFDDGIRTQVGEVFGKESCPLGEVLVPHRGGVARAALVKHDDAVMLEGHVEPVRGGRAVRHAWCLAAGTALKEREVGQVLAAGTSDHGGEDIDGAAVVRITPVQRDGEGVIINAQIPDVAGANGFGTHSYKLKPWHTTGDSSPFSHRPPLLYPRHIHHRM